MDECLSEPCEHGSTCDDVISGYTCDCAGTGYDGLTCGTEVDECASGPCMNNGTCADALNAYSCDCTSTGFEGGIVSAGISVIMIITISTYMRLSLFTNVA